MLSTFDQGLAPPSAVGWRVSVFWSGDKAWFRGVVVACSDECELQVEYDDGDVDKVVLGVDRVRFLAHGDADSAAAPPFSISARAEDVAASFGLTQTQLCKLWRDFAPMLPAGCNRCGLDAIFATFLQLPQQLFLSSLFEASADEACAADATVSLMGACSLPQGWGGACATAGRTGAATSS